MRRWIAAVLLLALAGGVMWWVWWRPLPDWVYVFPGVRGPSGVTRIAEPTLAKISDFERGGPHRLAILVTDETSGWLGLVRVFHAAGVPITVTQNPERALQHRVVFVYPIISGRTFKPEQLRALATHVREGGTLLTFNLAGGGLERLFGVSQATEGRARSMVTWAEETGRPKEDLIRVSRPGELAMGTVGYRATTTQVQASFDDGTAAVMCRTVVGQACLLGVDVGSFAGRGLNGRDDTMGRTYVNAYEPSLDVLVRWVRDLYVAQEPMPWLVGTTPDDKDVSILLTHDVDYTRSIVNAQDYADLLLREGLKGTFFIQTKYIKDYNDDIFYNQTTVPYVRRLVDEGMDVGSHTVAHSAELYRVELGSGRERYPRYQPFVETRTSVRGATVLGELRVSKFLLEDLAKAKVVSFRPGQLSYPYNLPEALQATGFKYSSSLTANVAMTHLPYQLTYERQDGALTDIYEFPVTIEDEAAPTLDKRYDAANTLIEKIAREHGLVVILMHPNVTAEKLAFEARIIREWKARAWMGSVSAFGGWWRARDRTEVDVVARGGRLVLTAQATEPVRGLPIHLPKSATPSVMLDLKAGQRTAIPVG